MVRAHDLDGRCGVAFRDARIMVRDIENSHFGHVSTGPNGQRDLSLAYRFETPAGSVVVTGDTGPSAAVTELARGADVLVSEVYLAAAPKPGTPPPAPGSLAAQLAEHMSQEHLSPEAVAKLAVAAGVKTLILTHLVVPDDPAVAEKLKARIAAIYKGEVIVGRDMTRFVMSRGF